MFSERRSMQEYYAHTKPIGEGLSAIDRAVEGQLAFDPALLPQTLNEELDIKIHNFDDRCRYSRGRNYGGLNVDLMTNSLDVRTDELKKSLAIPLAIEQQTRAVIHIGEDRWDFAGYSEYKHLYWRTGSDDRLQQTVKAVHIPSSVSPVVETISIDRYVLDWAGDLTYGHVILQTPEVTNKLGIRLSNGDPVFLVFTPDKVLATTYGPGPEVLGEVSYEALAETGIKARFGNEQTQALLDVGVGNLSFKLRLGKVLKPNYPSLLFSPSEEWITDSGIAVVKIPQEVLN